MASFFSDDVDIEIDLADRDIALMVIETPVGRGEMLGQVRIDKNVLYTDNAHVDGCAPDGLLDTYVADRHPIGARVLDWSRAQVSIMRPSPQARAMEAIVRDLVATRDGATYFADRVWNASLRYDFGEAHPLAGRSAPDFA